MYSEKAFSCLSVDLVLTKLVFLELVEDGLTNVFITETSPYKSYHRFSTYLVTRWESKVGIKMVKINISRRGDSDTHPQHVILWRTVCNKGNNTTTILSFLKTL